MHLTGLYTIIDPDFCQGRDPIGVAREVLGAGGRIIQLRCKGKSPDTVAQWAEAMMALKKEVSFIFILNDFVEVAHRCDADGVHLGQGDMSIAAARAVVGPHKLIGLSTHSLSEVAAANALPVDYIGFGAIFKTATKGAVHPVVGVDGLAQAVTCSRHPVVAIGGITIERLPLIYSTGAAAHAVLSAITQVVDIHSAVTAFCQQ